MAFSYHISPFLFPASAKISASFSSISSLLSFSKFARTCVLLALESAITRGCLEMQEGEQLYSIGKPDSLSVRIEIKGPSFWTRVLLHGDLGFSEAYMTGEVYTEDLADVMQLWLDNEAGMTDSMTGIVRLRTTMSGLSNALFGQTLANSKLNVIASYDQSNELFKAFLDERMVYSCALWDGERGNFPRDSISQQGARGGLDSLEAAQIRKIHHVLRSARVRPGDRILEFGSGWGALAIEAARVYGCEVDTITLSKEQKKLAEERICAAGLQERVRVHLLDYRQLPPGFEKAFDALISVEMIEHVGSKHYETYFKVADWALKSEDAIAVISSSTFPESRYTEYQAEDFMRKYMWPNSCLPSPTALINAAWTGAQGRLALNTVENHSIHYIRTLKEWNKRFDMNVTQALLAQDLPALCADGAAFAAFIRKWRYFFAYAGAGFARGYISCHMLTFARGYCGASGTGRTARGRHESFEIRLG